MKKSFRLGTRLYRASSGNIIARFYVDGVEYRRSTKTSDERLAALRAQAMYRELTARDRVAVERAPRTCTTLISTLCDWYLAEIGAASGGQCSPKTARANVGALRRITSELPANAPITSLTPELLQRWRAQAYARRGIDITRANDLALNYSLNSEHNSARAVFGIRARAIYARHRVELPPCVEEFCRAPKLPEKSTQFVPIPAEIDAQIRALCRLSIDRALRIPSSRDTWQAARFPLGSAPVPPPEIAVAVELARYCALTASEICAVCWDWLETRADRTYIAIRARPATPARPAFVAKNNKKYGLVPIAPVAVERWKRALPHDPLGYIIPAANLTARHNIIERAANDWLRIFLPDRTKKLHELRKQGGSEVAERTGSIKRAADFLRDSVLTAERHYASMLTPTESIYD